VSEKPPTPAERQATALEGLVELWQRDRRERARAEIERREEERRRKALEQGYVSEPKRLSFLACANAAPGLASIFSRKIPPEFWSLDTNTAIIACPCGETAMGELGVATFCGSSDWIDEDRERDDERDGCGRAYLYDGQAVRVAFSPPRKPQTAVAS
jgi:hypothetical protein